MIDFCRSQRRRWLLQEVRCPLLPLRWVERGGRQPLFGGARGPVGPHGQSSALRDRSILHSWHYGERQELIMYDMIDYVNNIHF